jgi:hypothetical protein
MKGDGAVEGGAEKLDALAEKAAAKGGVAGKLAGTLAEDASFLRKLKPSLMVARAKGRAPKNQEPGATAVRAPTGPQLAARSNGNGKGGTGGPNPLVVVGVAFALGTLLAKAIDWRSHAHPRL